MFDRVELGDSLVSRGLEELLHPPSKSTNFITYLFRLSLANTRRRHREQPTNNAKRRATIQISLARGRLLARVATVVVDGAVFLHKTGFLIALRAHLHARGRGGDRVEALVLWRNVVAITALRARRGLLIASAAALLLSATPTQLPLGIFNTLRGGGG